MRAGTLRSKARLYVPTSVKGADGSIEVSEKLVGDYYCQVRDYNKGEKDRGDKLVSLTSYRLSFRYQTGLKDIPANTRIVVSGLVLYVVSSSNKGQRDRMIEVIAESRR